MKSAIGRPLIEVLFDEPEVPPMTLADRLRAALEARGSTVAEAARLAGMSRQAAHDIVSGVNDNPKLRTLERLAGAVGVSLAELFAEPGTCPYCGRS